MNEHETYSAISQIYATFGKNPPSRGHAVVKAIADRVADIPDHVSQYIVDRIADNNSLPANLGKAFREAWGSYQQANPSAARHRQKCSTCHGEGGWIYFKLVEDQTREFWSFCPGCTAQNEATRKTPAQLEAEGCLVLPHGYRGGRVRFRQDMMIDDRAPANQDVRRSLYEIRRIIDSQRQEQVRLCG